ncbi:MAG: DUF5995 family protein, partial [Acidimicrobiales bacterium]
SASIDEVLVALDAIVARSVEKASRIGYFAAMYRKVTAKVKEGIEEGFFDDGERMQRLDSIFANRYLEALYEFETGGKPTRSWGLAFDAAADARPLIVQQLLLGVNAHINLDLGIAAATVAPGADLPSLRRDFDRINEILALQIDTVEDCLGEVSPWLGILDWIGGRNEEELIRFSIEVARTDAWRFANELGPLDRTDWGGPIGARDTRVAHLARTVMNPGVLVNLGLLVIRSAESNDVGRVIAVLLGAPEPALSYVDQRVRQWRASDKP